MPLDPTKLQMNERLLKTPRAYTTNNPITIYVNVTTCARWRVRSKSTTGGTLSFAYCRPALDDGGRGAPTPYTVGNPSNVAAVADTETLQEAEHFGEDMLAITLTPSASPGAWSFLDISRV